MSSPRYAPPYSTFTVEGAMVNINSEGSHHQDDLSAFIQGNQLVINDCSIEICRGVLADYTGLTGGTLALIMKDFNDNYTASAGGAVTITGDLPDTAAGDLAALSGATGGDPVAVMTGAISTLTVVNKFGRNPDVDTTSDPEDIYGLASGTTSLYNFSSSDETLYISSDNAADTMDVDLELLDGSKNPFTRTVTLIGTTSVEIGTSETFCRVNRARCKGATNNVGNIYIYANTASSGIPDNDTDIRGVIAAGRNQTEQAVYTVPNGFRGHIVRRWGTIERSGGSGTVNADMTLRAAEEGESFAVKSSYNISESNRDETVYPYGLTFPAKTDIIIRCEAVSASNSIISAGFDLLLEDMT